MKILNFKAKVKYKSKQGNYCKYIVTPEGETNDIEIVSKYDTSDEILDCFLGEWQQKLYIAIEKK